MEQTAGTTSIGDVRCDRLVDMLAELDALVADGSPVPAPVRIDRLAVLERLRSAVAAAQAAELVRFARAQVEEQLAADVHPRQIGRGIADQVGLACRMSSTVAARRLNYARAWALELPATACALTTGAISERLAQVVADETRHLDPAARGHVDRSLHQAGIDRLSFRAASGLIRGLAYRADPSAYLARGRSEERHRRVGLRPAPDTMTVLSGYLPVAQGVACYAALRRAADTARAEGDSRTRDQIMADTLVARVTGRATADNLDVDVQIVLSAGPSPTRLGSRRSPDMDRSRRRSPSASSTRRAAAPAASRCTPPPAPAPSLPSIPVGAASPVPWPICSGRATAPAGCHAVTPRSAILTTFNRGGTVGRPPWPTDRGCASDTTTSANYPAGRPRWCTTESAHSGTPSWCERRPDTTTRRRRRSRRDGLTGRRRLGKGSRSCAARPRTPA